MEKLGTYRNIFASSEAKVQQQLQVVAQDEVLVNKLDFKQKEKEEIEKNKKVLIITECGVPDYGTEEIKGKIVQAKVHSKMEVDININNKTEVENKTSNKLDKVKDISSYIWAQDVPTYTRAIHIKKALSFYRKVVHFEKDKMLRLTQGRFDKETLVERSKLKAILKNEDLNNALSSTVWYYDNKLEWINRRGFFNQGIQGAEVYAEASINKEPKSAEENNFGKKKGKERKKSTNRNITIAAHNINSLKTFNYKLDSLLHFVDKDVYNIIGIAETNLQEREA
ncbi:45161_t:CDS:2, partial [Gigaspora margarita]